MLQSISLWLLVGLFITWLLLDTIIKSLRSLWGFLRLIIDSKPIDLRSKFGEWAVVTGSSDGIGKEYAKELAARRINLVLISRSLEKLEKTKNEILEIDPKVEVRIVVADFSKGKEIYKKLKEELQDIPVGILVNNVGKMYEYPMCVGEVPEDDLWDIININVGATTLMTRICIEQMKSRGKGAIVNVSSASELQPLPLMTVYAATKIYIRSFSDALRAEYGRYGLTIQHLTPFFITTKMNAFSDRLQESNIFIPSATTYAKHALKSLGKDDVSTGYWAHGIQAFVILFFAPVWLRTQIGKMLNESFRQDYFKQKRPS